MLPPITTCAWESWSRTRVGDLVSSRMLLIEAGGGRSIFSVGGAAVEAEAAWNELQPVAS
jgi:hypothetical protein